MHTLFSSMPTGCGCGYVLTQLITLLGTPIDAHPIVDVHDIIGDLEGLSLYRAVLGWFAGITHEERFSYLFGRWDECTTSALHGTP